MALLTEKYRPTSFDEIIGQDHAVKTLQHFLETGNIPNIILHGLSSTGKTSLVNIFITELFGKNKEFVLQMSASEDRGIKIVRNVIKKFANYSTQEGKIKIVFLDEADSLTLDSQYALRRIMEDYARNTRFILTCNYLNKLIEPLISRCSVIQLHSLDFSVVDDIIGRISRKEKLPHPDVKELYDKYNGNLRKILNSLQLGIYDANNDINWNEFMTCPVDAIFEKIVTLFQDGNQLNYVMISFVNFCVENYRLDYEIFFKEVIEIISNLGNKGSSVFNFFHIIMYARKLIN